MKINYYLNYINNRNTDEIIKDCFQKRVTVIGRKSFNFHVFKVKSDVWLNGFYKGIAFGRKIAKLVSIINNVSSNNFKVKDVEFFIFSGEPPQTAMAVSVVEEDFPVPEIYCNNIILRGRCEFECLCKVQKDKIFKDMKKEPSKILIGTLNSKMYRVYVLEKIYNNNYCKIFAFGKHIAKVPLVLMIKRVPIKISKIAFFEFKESEKFPFVAGVKVVVVKGGRNEV